MSTQKRIFSICMVALLLALALSLPSAAFASPEKTTPGTSAQPVATNADGDGAGGVSVPGAGSALVGAAAILVLLFLMAIMSRIGQDIQKKRDKG